jgi:integrase/recombinase XerD
VRGRRVVPGWWVGLMDGYLRSLSRRGRQRTTIETYRIELAGFGAWIHEHGVMALPMVTQRLVERWQDDMEERQLKPSSRAVASYALRGLLKWATREELGVADDRLYRRIEIPMVPEQDPKPIPRRDLDKILHAFANQDRDDPWWLRTRALFLLLYASSARISEALSLDRGSLREDGTPVIQKGGRPHLLVVNEDAERAVAQWEACRTDDAPAMFINLKPAFYGRRLIKAEAQKDWNRLCVELGIERFTNHQVRHATGTTLRRRGADVVLISKHMGHRGLHMALRYVQIDVEDRQRAVALLGLLPAILPPIS